MAEKESKTTTQTTRTETDRPVAPPVNNKKTNWVVWLVIACVVVALLIAGGAVVLIHGLQNRTAGRFGNDVSTSLQQRFIPRQQFIYSSQTSTSGPTTSTTTTTYTYTQGVVTAVNSGSIVVAGNGKSQTIKTTSSTTYDSSKPAVNDNVVIVGTSDSNGAITAKEINVTNG